MDDIDMAFLKTPRRQFLPEGYMGNANLDIPLPIGFGQTISQPTTVRYMLDWLDVQPGDKVMDVGSGSGWTTALLSRLVGEQGQVFAVEIIPELVKLGRDNCQKLDIQNAWFFKARDGLGLTKYSPYDKILVSAATDNIPEELLAQLKPGGKMVIPVKRSIMEVEKFLNGETEVHEHYGFIFVPLVSKQNQLV